ncbi:unnamed protein product [Moneuplotes crassus]|uniref:Uncharacterized protein n=1 Tax=Euplotes crassus TaxID=5936 RepID=A0AAD1XHK3_EUPCR|nr:unnamed protein product [Moneuplotes crassus]
MEEFLDKIHKNCSCGGEVLGFCVTHKVLICANNKICHDESCEFASTKSLNEIEEYMNHIEEKLNQLKSDFENGKIELNEQKKDNLPEEQKKIAETAIETNNTEEQQQQDLIKECDSNLKQIQNNIREAHENEDYISLYHAKKELWACHGVGG